MGEGEVQDERRTKGGKENRKKSVHAGKKMGMGRRQMGGEGMGFYGRSASAARAWTVPTKMHSWTQQNWR